MLSPPLLPAYFLPWLPTAVRVLAEMEMGTPHFGMILEPTRQLSVWMAHFTRNMEISIPGGFHGFVNVAAAEAGNFTTL